MVWSDADVQTVAAGFVPAADEVNVVLWQRGAAEREWFRKVGEKGHYGKPAQGIYAAAPSGAFLGSINRRDPKAVAALLRRALEAYAAMDKAERLLPSAPPKSPAGPGGLYPEDGLVLQVVARDLPRADGGDKVGMWAKAWNSDYAWFTREEAQAMVPAPEAGARRTVPERLTRRLARYHLLDTVRGEPPDPGDGRQARAELAFEVTAVDGDEVRLRIAGASRTEEKDAGFESKIVGRATWNLKAKRFTAFEMVATGPRWGDMTVTGSRRDDPGPHPMGVAFRLAATREGSDRVPPIHVLRGQAAKYFAR